MDKQLSTVVLIDEYPLFRKAMADLLTASGDFQVIGQTSDHATALGLLALQPDLIVMNLEQEGMDTLQFLSDVKAHNPSIRVVMMMRHVDQSSRLMRAIRGTADGYLLRTVSPPEFVDQLYKACHGGMAASEKVTSALAELLRKEQIDEESGTGGLFERLTRREFAVLCCLASGDTNRDVAKRLEISEGTVKVHVKHVLKKLNFRSRVEVAVWATEHGYKLNDDGSVPPWDPMQTYHTGP